jgi:hypothetical protein
MFEVTSLFPLLFIFHFLALFVIHESPPAFREPIRKTTVEVIDRAGKDGWNLPAHLSIV